MTTILENLELPFNSKEQYEHEIMLYTFDKHDKDGNIENLNELNLSDETKRFLSILFGAGYYYEYYEVLINSYEKEICDKLDNTSDPNFKRIWLEEKINILENFISKAKTIISKYDIDSNKLDEFNSLFINEESLKTLSSIWKSVIENPITEIKSKYDIKPFCKKIVSSIELPKNNDSLLIEHFEKASKNPDTIYFITLLKIIYELHILLEKLSQRRETYLPKDEKNMVIRGFDCKLTKEKILLVHFKMFEKGFIKSEQSDFLNIFSNEPIVKINPIKWLICSQGTKKSNKTSLYAFLRFMLNNDVSNKDLKRAEKLFIDFNGIPIKKFGRPNFTDIITDGYGFERFFEKRPDQT